MTARFHTLRVPMAGVDPHRIEGATKPCIVAVPFDHVDNNDKFSKTVTGHTYAMVQRGYSLGYVPHLTAVTQAGAVELVAIIVASTSKAALGVASVSSEGEALATSMFGNAGLNLNCVSSGNNSAKAPTGMTISEFPLLTNPTDDDWVDFVLAWGWDAAFSWGLGRGVNRDKIPPEQRAIIKKFVSEKLKPRIEKEFRRLEEALKVVTRSDSARVFDTALD